MATSGKTQEWCQTSVYGLKFYMRATYLSHVNDTEDKKGNTSDVTVKCWVDFQGTTLESAKKSQTIRVIINDGTDHKFYNTAKIGRHKTANVVLIQTQTLNVAHDADGTKTIHLNFHCEPSIVDAKGKHKKNGTVDIDKNLILDPIQRTVTFAPVEPVTPSDNVKVGDTIGINLYDPTDTLNAGIGMYKKINMTFLDEIYPLVTKTRSNSLTNVPINALLQDKMVNTTSATATLTCFSYGDDALTQLAGQDSHDIILSANAEVAPTCTMSTQIGGADSNGVVQNLTNLTVKITGTATGDATISTYHYIINGAKYDSPEASITKKVPNSYGSSGKVTIEGWVTDSRGEDSAHVTDTTLPFYSYNTPTIKTCSFNRCTVDGTLDEKGTYIKYGIDYIIPECGSASKTYIEINYLESGTTTTHTFAVPTGTKEGIVGGTTPVEFNLEKTYEFTTIITDALGGETKYGSFVTSGNIQVHLSPSGNAVGIGKMADSTNSFECAYNSTFYMDATVKGTIHGTVDTTSDERLKDNIFKVNATDKLFAAWQEITIVTFNFKYKGGEKYVGAIAQQIIGVFDKYGLDYHDYHIVTERDTPDGTFYEVNYECLDMLTMAVVQNQERRLERLESVFDGVH